MVKFLKPALLFLGLFTVISAVAQPMARYQAGVHYTVLEEPVATEAADKIEVAEVFWYGCGHCYNFEPNVRQWEETMPEDVDFVRIPAIWNQTMAIHARAYYAAEQLGVIGSVHQAIFNAMHIDRKRLVSGDEITELFAKYGADKEAVMTALQSYEVTEALKVADAKARAAGVDATPQLVVDGRYRVGTNEYLPQNELFEVVNFLVEKARSERSQ